MPGEDHASASAGADAGAMVLKGGVCLRDERRGQEAVDLVRGDLGRQDQAPTTLFGSQAPVNRTARLVSRQVGHYKIY